MPYTPEWSEVLTFLQELASHTDCNEFDGSPNGRAKMEAAIDLVKRRAGVQELTRLAEETKSDNTCNMHQDCAAADVAARARDGRRAAHCWDDCCEDCFGC